MPLSPDAKNLIETSLSSDRGILKFGSFTLKSGRSSPYFFNFGLFDTGSLLASLSSAFASVLARNWSSIVSGDAPVVIFGPAYKGISLAATVGVDLYTKHNISVGIAYNRKEAKDHGEGGVLVGSSLKGAQVIIIDDVLTAGTAIREAISIVKGAGGHISGITLALDRQERGKSDKSTVQEVQDEYNVPILPIIRLDDIIEYLHGAGRSADVEAMQEYRKAYGVV